MRIRQAELGVLLQNAAMDKIRTIVPEKLTVREAAMLAEVGVRIERQARGDLPPIPDELVAHTGPTGADILHALKHHPELLDLADALDRVMLDDGGNPRP